VEVIMPVLAKLTYAGAADLAAGVNCIAHGLPSTPDVAIYQVVSTASLPVALVSRGSSVVVWNNQNAAVAGEMFAQVVHSIIC
jgi:hypothetical protein